MDTLQKFYETTYKEFGLNSLQQNWFSECGDLSGTFAWSIEIEKVLHQEETKYQTITILDSKRFGRCLVLNNAMEVAQGDEFSYHEMLSFLAINSHENPKKVLVIGGGDGGVVREVDKHPCVESIVLCDIDERVIEVSKKYLPFTSVGFQSKKLTVNIGDGTEYIRKHKNEFDVIITDATDPVGPSARVYENPYLESVKQALRPGGIYVTQAECYWFDIEVTIDFLERCRNVFPLVDYGASFNPAFAGGQMGYVLCGKSKSTNFRDPRHVFSAEILEKFNLKYYTPDVHRAAFALPSSINKKLGLKSELCLYPEKPHRANFASG